jgi:hypothetical protein
MYEHHAINWKKYHFCFRFQFMIKMKKIAVKIKN